jgi:hypothetical protein
VPVFKKGLASMPENYRNISLLNILSKVFEKVIFAQLDTFFNKYNIYDPTQFGFTAGKGCHDAICCLLHELSTNLDVGNSVLMLSLDISSAFDCVSHAILLRKLEFMGVRGDSNDLIKSYLSGRKQFVKYKNAISEEGEINKGVPQGSLVGPLMFNIMIVDLKFLNINAKLIKYADDIVILFNLRRDKINDKLLDVNELHEINISLRKILKYYDDNGFKLNMNKSSYMILGNKVPANVISLMNDYGFLNVSSLTYLGIIIDNKLKLSSQVSNIARKVGFGIGALAQMSKRLPPTLLLNIYFGHVHSHLSYCPFVLLRCTSTEITRLQSLQSRALKLVFKLPMRFSTLELFTQYAKNVLPVIGLIYYSAVMLVRKISANNSNPFAEMTRQMSSRRTCYKVSKSKLKVMKDDIYVSGIRLFNNLPEDIKVIREIDYFKVKLKKFLLEHVESLLKPGQFMARDWYI